MFWFVLPTMLSRGTGRSFMPSRPSWVTADPVRPGSIPSPAGRNASRLLIPTVTFDWALLLPVGTVVSIAVAPATRVKPLRPREWGSWRAPARQGGAEHNCTAERERGSKRATHRRNPTESRYG